MPEIGAPIPGKSKRCIVCKRVKPLSEYHRYYRSKDGYYYSCKPCNCARIDRNRINRANRPPVIHTSGMKVCKACHKEKPLAQFSTDRSYSDHKQAMCKACYKKYWRPRLLKKQYGISEEQYNSLLKKQGGVCAICKKPESSMRNGRVLDFAVDHNHTTKKNRGLLCHRCNTAIGLFNESIDTLQSAIRYLRNHQ